MFKVTKNIDTAFRQVRLLSFAILIGNLLFSCFLLYRTELRVHNAENKMLILLNGKVVSALVSDRESNLPVEVKDHVATFHEYFFRLSPDEKTIQESINKALYLADETAKRQYDDYSEAGYYSAIVSGNVNQSIHIDSIRTNMDNYPYVFKCYSTLTITRPTSIVTRSLVSEGQLRNVARSDNNSHGLLIERYAILENKDLTVKMR